MSQLDRIEQTLDKQAEHLASVSVTLAAQHVTLEDHIRRTVALEKGIAPLVKAHAMWSGVGRALAIGATLGTMIAAVIEALTWLRR